MAQVNPVRRWIISILIVCLIIAALFITAGHKTPMTNDAIVRAYVIKISPQVPGRIEKLYVKNNQMVKEGDPLFQIYQPPYLYALQKAKAELALTKSEVKMLESEISTAKALIKERTADFKTAKSHYKELNSLAKQGFVSHSEMLTRTKIVSDTAALLAAAKDMLVSAENKLGETVDGVNVHIRHAEAGLALAKLHYKETTVYAPVDGKITNIHTQIGNYSQQGEIQMALVSSHDWWIQANLKENNLDNVKPKQKVLISLNLYPGKIFTGYVAAVGKGINDLENIPNNYLPYIEKTHNWVRLPQRFPVEIKFINHSKKYPLRVGASANITIISSNNSFWLGFAYAWQWICSIFQYLA